MQELKPIKVEYKYLRQRKKVLQNLPINTTAIQTNPMEAVMNLNSIQINLQLGQEILVGKNKRKQE